MNQGLLQLLASSVTLIRAIAEANPEAMAKFRSHLPFHNAWDHIAKVDLPAVLGAEATDHLSAGVPAEPAPAPAAPQAGAPVIDYDRLAAAIVQLGRQAAGAAA